MSKQPTRRKINPRAKRAGKRGREDSLEGQLLIAMPSLTDRTFRRTVVYMCSHSRVGAMGLIVNRASAELTVADMLRQIGVLAEGIEEPHHLAKMAVHIGGPVEASRGFVLHSDDYHVEDATLPIGGGFALTTTVEVLEAIAVGRGPRHAMLTLGYAGWGAGQLESEIRANGWLHGPADTTLVFDTDNDSKYDRAMARIGVSLDRLSTQSGRA